MKKKSKINKKRKTNMIKSTALIFLSLMIFSSILLGNFDTLNNIDNENTESTNENDLVNKKISPASSQTIWNQTWDGPSDEYAESVWGDGTYLYTTGGTDSFGAGGFDLFIIKWDTDGNQIWNKTWGGGGFDTGKSIWGDGTYLYTTGITVNFGAGNDDLLLIKWDTDGNEIWYKTWGNVLEDTGHSVWGDGTNLYTTGYTYDIGTEKPDLLLIKWDTDGNLIWYKTWGGTESDSGRSVWGDGTYLYTTGGTYSFGEGEFDLVIIKWDADGNLIWYKTWGGTEYDSGMSVWGDGTYLYTTGYTDNFGAGHSDLLLIKWDTDGNLIWYKTWGEVNSDYGDFVWGDGTYLYTTGYTDNFGAGQADLLIVKWDTDGNQIWYQTYGGPNYDRGYSIWGDDTYIYAFGTMQLVVDDHSLFLVKMHKESLQSPILQPISPGTDRDGNITLSWNNIENATSYSLYRNTSQITELSDLTPISTSSATTYTDINLSEGSYYYVVVAKDGNRESDISNCESVKVSFTAISGYPFMVIISIWGISIIFLVSMNRYFELR
ncbi:MAG: hypothetical protein ACTSQ5_05945 [Promethearchaeota archaeon]